MADGISPGPVPDTEFVSTRYGLLRIAQAVIGLLCLILVELTGSCWEESYHKHNFFSFVSIYTMVFAVVAMILFCFRLHESLERYINVPLTLCVNEAIAAGLYFISSIILIVAYCEATGLSLLGKVAGVFGFVGCAAFGYAAFISYNWFRTGLLSQSQ